MEQRSDLELVQEVRNGKRQAFTELMRRYQKRVYWTARRIVGGHEEADDIAQETFVKAFLALGDFRGDSSFFTWLYRIAVNLSLNAVRKQQLMGYVRQSEIVNWLLPSRDNPDEQYLAKETASNVERAIAQLPEKQRAVFVMRYHEEMSYEEISKILHTSVGGLKANYFHALRKVQEFLKHET
jgi:RNA polymerase sigma-70 factor (ECF subfamily)